MLRGTLVRGRPCGAPSHGMEASAEKEGVTGQSSTWALGSLDGRRGTLFPAPCCPRAPFSRQQTLFRAKSSRKLFYLRQARGKLFGVEHRVGAFSLSHPSAASRPYQGAPLNLNIQMCPPKKLRPRHRRHEPRSQDTSACSPPPLGSDTAQSGYAAVCRWLLGRRRPVLAAATFIPPPPLLRCCSWPVCPQP